jgi:LysR family nitrogen assimilation transcriptional regulator
MNTRHLRYFVGIASAGTLSAAAERLYVTQSALSRAVAELERTLDCRLLERTKRGVVPTPQGAVLLRRARRLLLDLDAIPGELRAEASEPKGHVRLAMPTGVRDRLTRPLLVLLRRRHPGIRVDITESTARHNREAVLEGLADLAVTTEVESATSLHVTRLYADRLCLVGPPDANLSLRAPQAITCLSGKPLLLIQSPNNIRAIVDRVLRRLRSSDPPVMEASSSPLLINLVEDGHGFTVLPESTVAGAVKQRRVCAAPIARLALTWVLVLPKDRSVPHCVRLTADALKEVSRTTA